MLDRTIVAQELEETRRDLAALIAEAALGVAGVVDPTPTSDLAAASLSIARGDYWGAALDLVSCVPYAGDLVAKGAKAQRIVQRIEATRDRLDGLVQQMSNNPALKATGGPQQPFALTDGGIQRLSRDLPLPPWATDFRGWHGKRVLDAGAGGGTFVRELRAAGVEAYGIDLVGDTFRKAGIRHNDHFIQASADRIPMPDRMFDAATSNWSVFYYFDRAEGVMRTQKYLLELSRVVKPGGEIRLFGVDPRAASVIQRSPLVRVETMTPEASGTIPVMRLRRGP